MVVAIPLFHQRVAPRFDCASTFLLTEVDAVGMLTQRQIRLHAAPVAERVEVLSGLGVDALICGGIDTGAAELLRRRGICVIDWVAGEVANVVACFLHNELTPRSIVDHEGRCCGRWRFSKAVPDLGVDQERLRQHWKVNGRKTHE